MITVRFPSMLQAVSGGAEIVVREPVASVPALIAALDRLAPGVAAALDDPLYNVAVNDEMLLHGVARHPLRDGDTVEFVPTISGG